MGSRSEYRAQRGVWPITPDAIEDGGTGLSWRHLPTSLGHFCSLDPRMTGHPHVPLAEGLRDRVGGSHAEPCTGLPALGSEGEKSSQDTESRRAALPRPGWLPSPRGRVHGGSGAQPGEWVRGGPCLLPPHELRAGPQQLAASQAEAARQGSPVCPGPLVVEKCRDFLVCRKTPFSFLP